ncbi:MAG: undecaprenyl-diphosphate phosphatase [Actinobacteria bacterium]|nr:undecaprenyl-diphosphate phosphatase [Actinomycetota bacterium]MSW24482.1 undecaprenyl-diphosphate phosphatase [Actinomycetota bacterium]MSX29616.1 undecaprenyl-diphosphate phosphatase [Actinomycetota bacterium]MSX43726.1 undecaprenyl-diphosphate phosphatase [Actinomycetota bacterium]MSX97795.1 undecaprenyl-diphosphate phosphatase [Actinomycetota bacterium]
MSWLQAIILGISQGLTEFLPISSTAHTLIVSKLLGWPDPGAAFTAVTQVGTELAVVIYFRSDIARIISSWSRSLLNKDLRSDINAKMGWYVIIGTLPIAIAGILFRDAIETTARNLWLVAGALIVMGIALGLADRFARHTKDQTDLGWGSSIYFGIGQALALIPGVSRSGATITAGLLQGFKRDVVARYSFLLAIPAVFASAALEAGNISSDEFVNWPATLVATVIAFGVGYLVIAGLMKYLQTRTFLPFVIYRISLGVVLLGLLATGVLSAT